MMLGWSPEFLETKIADEGVKEKNEIMSLEEALKIVEIIKKTIYLILSFKFYMIYKKIIIYF